MDLNDPRIPDFLAVSESIARRAAALRATGQPLHAHALEYMLSSLSRRDALGDWSVLERLAAECDAAADPFIARLGERFELANDDGTYALDVVALEPTPGYVGPDFVLIVGSADPGGQYTAGVQVSRLTRKP